MSSLTDREIVDVINAVPRVRYCVEVIADQDTDESTRKRLSLELLKKIELLREKVTQEILNNWGFDPKTLSIIENSARILVEA